MTIPQLDETPTLFLLIGFSMLFLWVVAVIISTKQKDNWLCLGLLAIVFYERLPLFLFNREINPDESQMITQGMTLWQDPAMFRSVDTTTGGPLNSYLITFVHLFGLPFDYRTGHLLATLLLISSIWLIFRALSIKYDSSVALYAVLPSALFYAFAQHPDFTHYASELVAVLIISGVFYLNVLFGKKQKNAYLFISGFLLALLPIAKLQSLPIGFVLGLMFLYEIFLQPKKSSQKVAILVVGALTTVLILVGVLALFGTLDDFYTFYIKLNVLHQSDGSYLDSLLQFSKFIFSFDEVKLLFISLLIVFGFKLLKRKKIIFNINHAFLLLLWLMTIFALTKSGSPYGHYLHFMHLPFAWLCAVLLFEVFKKVVNKLKIILLLLLIAPYPLKFIYQVAFHKNTSNYPTAWQLQQTNVGNEIKKYAKSGEYLAVWGWRIDYHIETQMPQATNTNHNPYEILTFGLTDLHRKRYLADLQRNNPPVFVDATGKNCHWFVDRTKHGHEIFADLKNYIQNHYILANFVDDTRVYVRKDRMKNN